MRWTGETHQLENPRLQVNRRPVLAKTIEHHLQVLLKSCEVRDVELVEARLEECVRALPRRPI
jgi:hypothetical protein